MIQRCSECGHWCEVEKDGFVGKAIRGFGNATEGAGNLGSKIGKSLFGKTGEEYGAIIASGVAGGTGFGCLNALKESVFGSDYHFVCPNCGNEWGAYDDAEDQTDEFNAWLAEQERNEEVCNLRDNFPSIINSSEEEKYAFVKELQRQLSKEENTNVQNAVLYDTLAASYNLVGDKNNALKAVNESLALFEDDNTKILKGMIMGVGRNATDTYVAMQEILHYRNEERTESPYFTTQQIKEEYANLQSSYTENFLSIPQQKRKHLVVCDEMTYLPNSFRVLPIAEIPTDIKFPSGHPVSDTLYVCHPYRVDYYIPYETYEVEILRDEIEEFKTIMDHLGAKHIDYSDIFENGEDSGSQNKRDIHGGGDYAEQYKANFNYESEDNREISRKLRSSLEGSEDFLLAGKPTLPKDLVWYNHRKEWQHKCESRLAGRLVHSEFTISTSTSEMTTETERKKIEADLQILLFKAEGGTEGNKSQMLKKEKERTWKINVEFYPLSDYEKKETPLVTAQASGLLTNQPQPKEKKNILIWVMGGIILALVITLLAILL